MKQIPFFCFLMGFLFLENCKNEPPKSVEKSPDSEVVAADLVLKTAPTPMETVLPKNTNSETEKPTEKAVETTKKNYAQPLIIPKNKVEKKENLAQNNPIIIEQVLVPEVEKADNNTKLSPNYDEWESVLQKFVSNVGKVNYRALKANRAEFDLVLSNLTQNPPEKDWSRAEKMSFWINVYNASTIALILDNYPIRKITDLDGGKTWDLRRIEIGGEKYSLNQIENDILRAKFKDARIHFAVNCAAKSCPPLLNQAFRPQKLEAQLENQTQRFIKNQNFNQITTETAAISKIFDWYAVDFLDLVAFLNSYAANKMTKETSIKFNEYDWNLNE